MIRSTKRDRRIERTRQAILGAFRDLVLTRGYDAISVRDIVEAAGVGRSTFYEHFDDKDDLFRASLHPLLTVLAEAIGDGHDLERLQMVIAHFGQNRRLARVMLAGSARRLMSRFLAEELESRLADAAGGAHGSKPLIPLNLVAAHLAEAQLGLIESWMLAKNPCASETLAHALSVSTRASALALLAAK